ncbi:phage protein [Streptococcus porcinus]|uniref:Phage protein n=1 Tax=Streptococcus porcinus TaxID=1340 RepID=A0A4V0HGR8_STRPO|nr:hypothetical protein [Streptococcus porcinus]VTT47153.1 phage protein [Streptococcus porcinus]
MNKKIILVVILCLSACAMKVSANASVSEIYSDSETQNNFIFDEPQQTIKDDSGKPISIKGLYVGSREITVNIPIGWWGYLYRQSDPSNKNRGNLVIPPEKIKYLGEETDSYKTDIFRQYYSGTPYTIDLKDTPLKKGERLTFSFKRDDGFYAGSSFYKDFLSMEEDKQYNEEIKKIEDGLERQDQENNALELFKQQQQEEANKTWYQRLGDSIQDQLWNFNNWWKE